MESTKRLQKRDVIIILILITPVAIFCGYCVGPLIDTAIAGAPAPSQWRAFDDAQWRANPQSRPSMVCHLQFCHPLKGLDHNHVLSLLGQPDGPYAAIARLTARQKTATQDPADDYLLTGCIGACSHMLVSYGTDGKVDKVFVLQQSPF